MAEYFGNMPNLEENTDNAFPEQHVIGEKEIGEATKILTDYKDGKANLERRIVENEQWWKLRHWDVLKRRENDPQPHPESAWLFNGILNKHADAMDNYPEPVVLPRERSDEKSAKTLSSILPVIMEYNDFEETYSSNWWEKLKHGTAAYGVFWDSKKENGLGDIEIKQIDLLNIFWEPGITDIQDSQNLFIVELVDEKILNQMYPEYEGHLKGDPITVKQYIYDDAVDTSEKALVIDWYYKVTVDTRTVLHYVKYVGNTLLYASENDPQYMERGFYDHGMYPVVFDTMFPEKGTPVGFGYVAIQKGPQMYIDRLSANIMEASMMGTKKRFFVSANTGVNVKQFMDWNEPIVEVEGELGEERIREITVQPLPPIYENVLQMKIEEMKDTSGNRDVNSGGGGGLTAASAIAALQEAGNKTSRDMIATSYRAYTQIVKIVIELMRQFYDEVRSFRITGEMPGQYDFVDMSNIGLMEQQVGTDTYGNPLYRKPVFDLKIKAQKKNPFSRMEENERAKELYGLGFFSPDRAQEALGALQMMDFEGKEKVVEYAQQGQTLMNVIQQMQQQIAMLMGQMAPPMEEGASGSNAPKSAPGGGNKPPENHVASGIMEAQTPMTSYGQRLAKRSAPDMNSGSAKDLTKK